RLNIADASQQQRGQQLLIGQPALDPDDGLVDQILAGSLLEKADERLDLGTQPDDIRFELRLVGRNNRQLRTKLQVAQTENAGPGRRLKKLPTRVGTEHRGTCVVEGRP